MKYNDTLSGIVKINSIKNINIINKFIDLPDQTYFNYEKSVY
jgi:hypothetical protein